MKKLNWFKWKLQRFLNDQRGVSTVEIILILVVLIAIVIIFKGQIVSLVNTVLEKVMSQGKSV